jgi:hypothetical protein
MLLPAHKRCTLLFLPILSVSLAGCGGTGSSNTTSSNAAAPAPASSTPPSTGSGSSGSGSSSSGSTGSGSGSASQPGGSGGTSGGSTGATAAATEFQAILIRGGVNDSATQAGTITIDANGPDGNGQVQVSGGDPNFNYHLTFCSFRTSDCIVSGNVNTDASGNATVNFQFPSKGILSGSFTVAAPGDTKSFYSTFPAPPQNGQYVSALQRASVVNDIGQMRLGTAGSDPLKNGQLVVTPNQANVPGQQTSVKFTLNGAAPNQSYLAGFCSGPDSSCYVLTGKVTTAASGNASASLPFTTYNPAGVFFLSRDGDSTGTLEFIVGFQVQ